MLVEAVGRVPDYSMWLSLSLDYQLYWRHDIFMKGRGTGEQAQPHKLLCVLLCDSQSDVAIRGDKRKVWGNKIILYSQVLETGGMACQVGPDGEASGGQEENRRVKVKAKPRAFWGISMGKTECGK